MISGAQNQDFRTIPFLWPPVQGFRALDLGCGNGLYTGELARQGACPVGMDLDLQEVRNAKLGVGDSRILWIRADAAYLPFRPGSFDLIVSVEVLTHIPPEMRARAFEEISRTARPKALVFLTLHNRARLSLGRWFRLQRSKRTYTSSRLTIWPTDPDEARVLALRYGMKPVARTRYLNYHSRFRFHFSRKYPRLSRVLAAAEYALSSLPLLRRLGITFLLPLAKVDEQ